MIMRALYTFFHGYFVVFALQGLFKVAYTVFIKALPFPSQEIVSGCLLQNSFKTVRCVAARGREKRMEIAP